MSGDSLKKVRSGDRLRIPAKAYNRFVDAARAHHEHDQGRDARPVTSATGIVRVRNQSGQPRGRFDVLGLSGPIISPDANLDHFKSRIAFDGVTPTSGHRSKFAILLEPLKEGAIGKGIVAGVTVARIDVESTDHGFASVDPGEPGHLKSASVGAAQILWREEGSGEKWAVVRLGPSPDEQNLVLVSVMKDGGDKGGWDETCSFTYSFTPPGGETVENVTPDRPRFPNTPYKQPEPGSPGLAYRAGNEWHLYDVVEEIPETETLSPHTAHGIDTGAREFWFRRTPVRVLAADDQSDRDVYHTGRECPED